MRYLELKSLEIHNFKPMRFDELFILRTLC